jgi:hypothetical protein
MNHSSKRSVRSRRIRIAAWSGVGLAAAAFAPAAAIAVGQPLEIRVAYLDPGTGSLILQALVAALAGAIVVVTSYWQKIRALFRRSSRDSETSDNAPSDD